MSCGQICGEEKERSENVIAIRRNVEEFMWKITDLDSIDSQEKFALSLFKKLGSCSSIEDLANMSIDMMAAIQKIKLKKENEEEDNKDDVFIELFAKDVKETTDDSKEDME